MSLHITDANMRTADAFHASALLPDDFDACCNCGCGFADPDNDDHDPHHIQSKQHPALCQFCADTLDDE